MTVYYVATTGSDGAAGTLGAPFATVAHALTLAGNGDTVLMRGGTYIERIQMTVAGVALEAYKPTDTYEPVIVSGNNYTLPNVTSEAGGTNAYGTWSTFNYAGLIELTANNTILRGIKTIESKGRGIEVGGVDDTHRTTGNIVEDCQTVDSRHAGFAAKYCNTLTFKRHYNKNAGNFAAFRRPTGAGIPNNHPAAVSLQVIDGLTMEDIDSCGSWCEGQMLNNVNNWTAKRLRGWDNMVCGLYINASASGTLDGWVTYYSDTGRLAAGGEIQAGLMINREDHKADWGALETVCHDFTIMNGLAVNCDRGISLLGGKGLFLFSNLFFYNNTIVRPSRGNSAGVSSAIFVAGVAQYSNIKFGNNAVQLTDTALQDPVTAPNNSNITWLPNAWSEQPPATQRNAGDIYGDLLLVDPSVSIAEGAIDPDNYKLTGLSPARFSAPRIAAVVNDYFGEVRVAPDSFGFDLATTGGSGPPPTGGDVVVGVAQNTSSTASGTVSVVDTTMGVTPVAALVVINNADSISSGVATAAMAKQSIGFYDGTNSLCMSWRAKDASGAANTDDRMVLSTAAVARLLRDGSTNLDHELTAAFVTNGLQLTKAATQTAGANIIAALWGGADVSAQVGTVAAANAIAGTSNITLPWVPSLMIFVVGNGAFDGTVRNNLKLGIAVATGTSNQHYVLQESTHNVSPSAMKMRMGSGFIAVDATQTHEITAWGTTTTIRTNTATGVRTFGYLALRFASGQFYAGIQTIPTATGNKTFTAVNFTPAMVGMVGSLIRTVASDITDGDANGLAWGLLTANAEQSMAAVIEDAQTTPDTESLYGAKSLRMGSVVGTDAAVATRTAMLSTGPQINFSTTPGTADRQMLMFAVEQVSNATVTADFTGTPLSGTVPFDVVFTDASSAVDTTITSRSWSFGDGGISTSTNPTHSYTVAGTYTVVLTVSDGTINDTKTRTAYVVASDPPPTPPTNRYIRGAGGQPARITGVKRGAGVR